MAFSLKSIFPSKKIHVDQAGLTALDDQFKDLGEKVKAGDYVVTANAKPIPIPGRGVQRTKSIFDVTIKPSNDNRTASIKSMTFEYIENFIGSDIKFTIKTRDDQTLVSHIYYEPGKAGHPQYNFLDEISKLAHAKIAQDKSASQQKSAAAIKNIVKPL